MRVLAVIRELERSVRRLALAERPLLVAVSGGIDSTALACALHEISQKNDLKLLIAHVNHGLRGEESDADEAAVTELAERLGLPFRAARVEPGGLRAGVSSRQRPTRQEAARALRYRALGRLADAAGGARIATAHTADDQAETVLLRLLRGTGPDGLCGIPERSPDGGIVRPLLGSTRRDIEVYAGVRGLRWREDASNQQLEYARNRLRLRWLPGLARDFNPQLLRALAGLAEAQRRDSEWIEAMVECEAASRFVADGSWLHIDVENWDALPEALARRLARRALQRCGAGRHASRAHLERMQAFLRCGRRDAIIELPGGLRLRRDAAGVALGPVRFEGVRDHFSGDPGGAC